MCIDMGLGVCIYTGGGIGRGIGFDMYIDIGAYRYSHVDRIDYRHVYRSVCIITMFTDMPVGMLGGMFRDKCIGISIDTGIHRGVI